MNKKNLEDLFDQLKEIREEETDILNEIEALILEDEDENGYQEEDE